MAHPTPTTDHNVTLKTDDVSPEDPSDAGYETPKASASTQPAWKLEEFPGLNEDKDGQEWDFADDGKGIPKEKIGFYKKRGFHSMTPEEFKKHKEAKRKDKQDKQPEAERTKGWLDWIGTKE
jgi:hypothetical protein